MNHYTAERIHGLQILTQQLTLLYDPHSRLRLYSRADRGTLAVFMVPNEAKPVGRRTAGRK